MPAGSPRAGQGHRCPRLHPGLLRSHEGWGWGTPWCEPSRKHPQGLVVGTRQGWAEKGIFAPSRGGTEATHDPGAPPTLPRRIPSVLGWEGHHRITTESESEVNVKRSVSSLGNPSRMVGRRAQCGPRIWGVGSMCMGPCPNSPRSAPPSEPTGGGSGGTVCRGSVGVTDPCNTPTPPCTFPGGTRTHPGPVPIYILGFTHTHLGFWRGSLASPALLASRVLGVASVSSRKKSGHPRGLWGAVGAREPGEPLGLQGVRTPCRAGVVSSLPVEW